MFGLYRSFLSLSANYSREKKKKTGMTSIAWFQFTSCFLVNFVREFLSRQGGFRPMAGQAAILNCDSRRWEGKRRARLCVTLFFPPLLQTARRVWWLSFYFFLREDREREERRGTSNMSPTFRLQLSPSGMPIIIISLLFFLSYPFTYYYYYYYIRTHFVSF